MTILYITIGALVVVCAVLMVQLMGGNKREREFKLKLEEQENRKLAVEQQSEQERESKDAQTTQLRVNLARAELSLENLKGERDRMDQELEEQQTSFRLEFRNLANEILEEKSTQFKSTNKEALDGLLKPLHENITKFRDRVDTIYADENKQRGAMQKEMERLLELNNRITQETTNLTKALRGESKVQGDWGETILRTVLESFNMISGLHYTMQENLKDEHGRNLRPDAIINLPDNRRIIVDSKVSLTAFVNFSAEEDASRRAEYLKEHIRSVRRHVDDLGSKSYQDKLVESPDFVVMFIPNEPAYIAALQNDSAIWNDAYRKKIVLSSPTNLFTILKIVDDLWQSDNQNRNALEIAEAGGRMYDKFVGFVESMETLGRNIESASTNYDKALGQLHTGHGSLTRRAELLKEMGAKTSKQLSAKYIESDDEDDNVELSSTERLADGENMELHSTEQQDS